MNSPELIAVVGHPISHSKSPVIHTAAFQALGLNAQYLAGVDVRPEDAPYLVHAMKACRLRQLAVTVPHKTIALTLADSRSPIAENVGAANTLTRLNDGSVRADNTDWVGVRDSLQEVGSWQGKTALIIGAGGAARGAIYGLKELGMEISITNRTRAHALQLINEFDIQEGDVKQPYDLLFHATTQGLRDATKPENILSTPIDASFLSSKGTVFDSVMNPLETRLLREAREAGCQTIDGMQMLVYQAIEQIRLWTDVFDPAVSARVVEQRQQLAGVMRAAFLNR